MQRFVLGLLSVACLLVGCGDSREMVAIQGSVSVPPGPVDLRLDFQGGMLRLAAAPEPLPAGMFLQGEFRFDREEMRPHFAESLVEGREQVVIDQPGGVQVRGRSRNEWQLAVSRDHAVRLSLDHRIAGLAQLNLAGLTIERLEVEMGAGQLDVDFGATAPPCAVTAVLDLGHGTMRIHVPDGVGVRVRGRKAVGRIEVRGIAESADGWESLGFAAGGATIDLAVGMGTGEVIVDTVPWTP